MRNDSKQYICDNDMCQRFIKGKPLRWGSRHFCNHNEGACQKRFECYQNLKLARYPHNQSLREVH